jgi:DNA mismatch repair ATPase MutL
MKTLGTVSMAVILLLIVGSLGVYAQDRDAARPGQAQEEKDKAKANEKDKDKPQDKAAQQDEKRDRQQPGAKQDERRDRQQEQKEQRSDQRSDQRMERNEHQHPAAGKGKKIPDEKFRSNFGRQHTFKVQRTQIINNPQPVVVYGGFNFQLIDAWPSVWGFDDPVYIDYDPASDQYFMINSFHPEVRVAVFVVE